MTVAVVNGSVVTPAGVVADGYVLLDEGVVSAVGSGAPPEEARTIDAAGGWIAPGFIDVQINGGHGIDLTTQPERIDELGAFLVRYGVTAFVPTIITCPPECRGTALEVWRARHDQAPVQRCRSACTSRARCCRQCDEAPIPSRCSWRRPWT